MITEQRDMPAVHMSCRAMPETANVETRTVTFVASTGERGLRSTWDETYLEELEISGKAIRLERLNNRAPFMRDHSIGNIDNVLGVIERSWIENNELLIDVRFSERENVEPYFRDIMGGILPSVSVQYRVHEYKIIGHENKVPIYRAVDWEPFEVSVVDIAFEANAKSRSSEKSTTNPVKIQTNRAAEVQPTIKEVVMTEATTTTRSAAPVEKTETQTDAQRIAAAGKEYGANDLAMRSIQAGASYDAFQRKLLTELNEKRTASTAESTIHNVDMSKREEESYSLMNVVRALATGKIHELGIEREVSEDLAKRANKDAQGLMVPYSVLGRTQSAAAAGKGAELVATDLHSGSFIEALRAKAVMGGLGAHYMTGLVGNVDIPKHAGSATFYWVAEDGVPDDSELGFSVVQMSPKTIASAVPITRRLSIQSSPDIEALVRDDILQGLALGLDYAQLAGTGTGEQPLGILNAAGLGAVDITGGVNWAKIVALETDVCEANVTGTMNYLMRPSMRGTLKTTEKAANTGIFLMGENGNQVNGYGSAVTTQMTANQILFGDFSQSMVGFWGAVDLVADKSTKAASGGLVLRAFQDADTAIRHSAAFSLAK